MAKHIDMPSLSKRELLDAFDALKRKRKRDIERHGRESQYRRRLLEGLVARFGQAPMCLADYSDEDLAQEVLNASRELVKREEAKHKETRERLAQAEGRNEELFQKAVKLGEELGAIYTMVGAHAPEGTPFLEEPRRAMEFVLKDLRNKVHCLEEGLRAVVDATPPYYGEYPEGCPAELEPSFAVEMTLKQLRSDNKVLQDRLAAIHAAAQGPVPGCDACENAGR